MNRGLRLGLALAIGMSASAMPAADAKRSEPMKPADGQIAYWFGLNYIAGHLEFRDPSGTKWPSVFYEKKHADLGGKFIFDEKKPVCSFTLPGSNLVQREGDQSLKVLGELLTDSAPILTVKLAIDTMGTWLEPVPDATGRKPDPFTQAEVMGRLLFGERTIPVKGIGRFSYARGNPGGGMTVFGKLSGLRVRLRAEFEIAGKDLGLRQVERVLLRVTSHAYDEANITGLLKGQTLEQLGIKR